MNRKILYALILLTYAAESFAQKPFLQFAKKGSEVYGKRVRQHWDESNNNWFNFADTTLYTYNTGGKRMLEMMTDISGQLSKREYVYNTAGKLTAMFSFRDNNSVWDTTEYSSYTYNSNGNIIGTEYYSYSGGNRIMDWKTRSTHVYSTDNKVIEFVSENWVKHLNNFRNEQKVRITYRTNGEPDTYTIMEWDTISSVFRNADRISDIEWQRWSGNIDETGIEDDPSVSLLKSYKELFWNGTTYQQDGRYTATYDSLSNTTEQKTEELVVTTWKVVDASRYTLSYTLGRLTERISENWDINTEMYKYNQKENFSDFQTVSTGLSKLSSNLAETIFPNPAKNELFIQVPAGQAGQLEIKDITGKTWIHQKVQSPEEKISVAELPAGIYIIRISSGENGVYKKFVKE